MGDMGEIFREMKADRQDRHRTYWAKNMSALEKSGLEFRVANRECVLFRETGKPSVDFYPSTGRYRVNGGKARSGSAERFINWYEKQTR